MLSGSFSSQLHATWPSCKNGPRNAFLTALAPFLLNSHEEPRPSATCRESLPGAYGCHVRPCFIQKPTTGILDPGAAAAIEGLRRAGGHPCVQEFEDIETAK